MKLKRASIFTKIVIALLVVYACVSLIRTRAQITEARQAQETVRQQVTDLMLENAEISYDIEHAGDDSTIESIARTKLGLVKPGEKIFYDVSN